MNDDFFYKKKAYDGYDTYCKTCVKEKAWAYQLDNMEEHVARVRSYNRTKDWRIKQNRANAERRRKNGQHKEWVQKNPDKLKFYAQLHQDHNISNDEWEYCKDYFGNQCAYCEIHISEHFNIYAGELKWTDFHKEHVNPEGTNDLTNCVPACKSCNSRKHNFRLEEWYSLDNPYFSEERLNKIIKWISEDAYYVLEGSEVNDQQL
jgi:5-methylcytosine-specific restriction endonuclease McrA